MRFLTLVKSAEPFVQPPPALMEAIGRLGEEAMRAGTMVDMGGLLPSAMGTRFRIADGRLNVTDGPFSESKEVVGGYAIFDVASREEALEWTRRFMELHRELWPEWEGETEVRPLFGPGDMPG